MTQCLLSGPHGLSGGVQKLAPFPPEFEPWTVVYLSSRCTDHATWHTTCVYMSLKYRDIILSRPYRLSFPASAASCVWSTAEVSYFSYGYAASQLILNLMGSVCLVLRSGWFSQEQNLSRPFAMSSGEAQSQVASGGEQKSLTLQENVFVPPAHELFTEWPI